RLFLPPFSLLLLFGGFFEGLVFEGVFNPKKHFFLQKNAFSFLQKNLKTKNRFIFFKLNLIFKLIIN
ncbi:hypothetical protein CCZ20_28495, partial [Priestia aryabhattai]|uniref:hypothetical protein n=1 Tax=Priestia aryabhattai TaxID=412384 RepID=UPI000B625EB2